MESSSADPHCRPGQVCIPSANNIAVSYERDISHLRRPEAAVTASPTTNPHVFISHSHSDLDSAEVIANALATVGIATTLADPVEATGNLVVTGRLSDTVRTSDIVIALISAAALRSTLAPGDAKRIDLAVSSELEQRGVAVIPALLDDTPIATRLGHRQCRRSLQGLRLGRSHAREAGAGSNSHRVQSPDRIRLRETVADLLQTLGFEVTSAGPRGRQPRRSGGDP